MDLDSTSIRKLRRFNYKYLLPMVLIVLLYQLTQRELVNPLWLPLIIAFPTFGYAYLKSARRIEIAFYVHVVYRFFKWDTDRFFYRWKGLFIVPVVTVIGYFVGVMLALNNPFVLILLTIGLCVYFVQKCFK